VTAAELTRQRLLDIAAVTTMVGATGVDTLLLKPGTITRRLRVHTISGIEDGHLRGSSGIHDARVQVDAIAAVRAYPDALTAARELSEAAHGDGAGSGLAFFSGTVAGSPSVEILAIEPASDPLERFLQEEQEYVTVSRDYRLAYRSH